MYVSVSGQVTEGVIRVRVMELAQTGHLNFCCRLWTDNGGSDPIKDGVTGVRVMQLALLLYL